MKVNAPVPHVYYTVISFLSSLVAVSARRPYHADFVFTEIILTLLDWYLSTLYYHSASSSSSHIHAQRLSNAQLMLCRSSGYLFRQWTTGDASCMLYTIYYNPPYLSVSTTLQSPPSPFPPSQASPPHPHPGTCDHYKPTPAPPPPPPPPGVSQPLQPSQPTAHGLEPSRPSP